MRFTTASEMRLLDARAESDFGIPTSTLMNHAGLAVAEAVRRVATLKGIRDLPVLMFAGRGNNGGDVFAAALFLREWGIPARVFAITASTADMRTEAARSYFGQAAKLLSVESVPSSDSSFPFVVPHHSVVVDGLLGTGVQGDPRGAEADAIRAINRLRDERGAFVVAVDLPSGMNADDGTFGNPSVFADLTVTLALPKLGMATQTDAVAEHCGRIEVADIGLPARESESPKVAEPCRGVGDSPAEQFENPKSEVRSPVPEDLQLIAEAEVDGLLPRRKRSAHKGDFGHVVLVGGSAQYTGAIALAAEAAARGGAGLVSVATVCEAAQPLRARLPEAMVRAVDAPALSRTGLGRDFQAFLRRCGTLVVGPGIGLSDDAVGALECALESGVERAVIDADALTLLAAHPDLLETLPQETVLTPHPGEAARLLGTTAAEVQHDRPAALRALVERTKAAVVLKGNGTLVGAPGHGIHLLRAGNPGMATGGSGDVLAGLTGAFLAQGLSAFDAARAAVWHHAKRGDEAAWRLGEAAVLPRDLIG